MTHDAKHADIIERNVEKTNLWLNDLANELETDDRQAAYRSGQSGGVRHLNDRDTAVVGRHVLVGEDGVDTGLTLNFLAQTLALREPASLAAVTLLDRPYRRLVDDVPLRHVGFTVPDELFAGYGLGLDERWRALPDLHVVEIEELPGHLTGDSYRRNAA